MSSQDLPYSNFSAIITGGGGLLGREHAIALAEIGYTVYLLDSDIESLTSAKHFIEGTVPSAEINSFVCDITSEESIRLVIGELKQSTKKIKCLINNASVNPGPDDPQTSNSIDQFSSQQWNRELSVGLTGAILMCKHVGPLMIESQGGFVLNISSDLSVISPDQRIYRISEHENYIKPISYSIIKTGLIGLTRYLATYWAQDNIRVNALSPGGVENGQPKEFISNIKNLIPMSRMAQKNEYRGVVQFLCSEQSSYMTGQNLVVDGGRSVW